jgi:chemotaxis protein MotB
MGLTMNGETMEEENQKTGSVKVSAVGPGAAEKDTPDLQTPKGYWATLPPEESSPLFSRGRQPRRVVWSVAWSDLMMTMFILFAVLYIYQAANREFSFIKQEDTEVAPEAATATSAPPMVETLVESLDAPASRRMGEDTDTVRLRHLSDIGAVELEADKAVRIVLPGDLLFDTGSSDLKSSSLDTLRQVADAIRITDYRVNVVGHTDSVPMYSEKITTNWELSALRACTVARFLMEQMDLSPARFYVSGYAYLQPVAPNDSPANRAANRRVELVLTRDIPMVESR